MSFEILDLENDIITEEEVSLTDGMVWRTREL